MQRQFDSQPGALEPNETEDERLQRLNGQPQPTPPAPAAGSAEPAAPALDSSINTTTTMAQALRERREEELRLAKQRREQGEAEAAAAATAGARDSGKNNALVRKARDEQTEEELMQSLSGSKFICIDKDSPTSE